MNVNPLQLTDERAAGTRPRVFLAFDPLLLVGGLGLIICSLLTLRGPGRALMPSSPTYYTVHQAIYAAIGFAAALVIAQIDYSRLREYRYVLYGLMIALNLVVYGMPATLGAHRWIPLPLLKFQTSEFGKLLLILSLSAFCVERSRRLHEWRTTARIMLLGLVPAMIVIPQPDLGTGLVYITITFLTLVFAGTSWKQLSALVAMFVTAIVFMLALAPALGFHVLKTYQKERLTTFINPSTDPAVLAHNQTAFQLYESEIAVGSGGKTGRGLAGATQTKFHFLPEEQTDFVFAVLGETYGFVGAAFVLSLYALLIWRTLRIITIAKNLFGTLIAGGILAMLMFQVFINVGMTIGVMPVTGVPLPLMSYGGSSVLVTFIALGLLQSIHIQARIATAGKARVLL
ncbi:MAG: rod shape-determining protein RodA [Solirubrobacteraceae bacterium]